MYSNKVRNRRVKLGTSPNHIGLGIRCKSKSQWTGNTRLRRAKGVGGQGRTESQCPGKPREGPSVRLEREGIHTKHSQMPKSCTSIRVCRREAFWVRLR